MTDDWVAIVERVARHMAIADGHTDPDTIAWIRPNGSVMQITEFSKAPASHRGPIWTQYMRKANLFVAGMSALTDMPVEGASIIQFFRKR
jgi:hypothetical protein